MAELRVKGKTWIFLLVATLIVAAFFLHSRGSQILDSAYSAIALFGVINAAVMIVINYGTVPEVAISFTARGGTAVRVGYYTYIAFAASAIALLGILALCLLGGVLDMVAPALATAATGAVAVTAFTTLISLTYVDRLVYEDFGVHIYEFDIVDVLRDGVARKHIGVRPEDLRAIYRLIALLMGAQALLFAASYFIAQWLSIPLFAISLAGLSAGLAFGYWGFRRSCAYIPANNFEFFDSLPLASHLLLRRSGRPFIPVRTRLGPSGYPVLNGAHEAPAIARKKNIVVLLNDGLRADHVSREAGLTPNIFAFIDRTNPYVATRHFSASHFTDQSVFGMLYGVDAFNFVPFLQDKVHSYPLEILKRNGYVTAFFTHSILNKFPNNWLMDLFDESANAASDDEVVQRLEHFLTQRREDSRPFIVFAFVYTPHWPYEFKDAFAIDRPHNRMSPAPHEVRLATRNSYRNAVRQADDYFRQVTGLVEDDVRRGDTIFVFTSDHGTEFWEHDTIIGQGKSTFWKEKVEVPFIVAVNGFGTFSGAKISSHIDLMPTLLDLIGAQGDHAAFSDGTSLYSENGSADRPIIISGRLFPYVDRSNAIVDGRSKYWFRTSAVTQHGGLDLSLFRAMTLDDVTLTDTAAKVPENFSTMFEARFLKYLEIVQPRS